MARYFDLSNSTFRNQALAILMLLLLVASLVAARGTMAYQQGRRGAWYQTLVPPGAKPSSLSIMAALPADTVSYILHQPHHHRVTVAFFNAGRDLILGPDSTKITAGRFIKGVFPQAHGWAAPAPSIENIMGVPILIWRSQRVAEMSVTKPRMEKISALRFLIARSAGSGQFHVALIGYTHGSSNYDRRQFLRLVAGMAQGSQ